MLNNSLPLLAFNFLTYAALKFPPLSTLDLSNWPTNSLLGVTAPMLVSFLKLLESIGESISRAVCFTLPSAWSVGLVPWSTFALAINSAIKLLLKSKSGIRRSLPPLAIPPCLAANCCSKTAIRFFFSTPCLSLISISCLRFASILGSLVLVWKATTVFRCAPGKGDLGAITQ